MSIFTTNLPNSDDQFPFGSMESNGAENISLKSVSVEGKVEGLLFSSHIRQEYKNETDETLEIIYTFPLGWGTALLGMRAAIGGQELTGQVVEKVEAETKYEEAISKGDSAIMVQKSSEGLYTASLGNVKPGENVAVELHCARLLNFEQGRVRICIPTVVGERYGDPYGEGGLAAHESVTPDARARYSFGLKLSLYGDIAGGKISCPSHEADIERNGDCVQVSLGRDAVLDRDFILLLEGLDGQAHAMCLQDDGQWMACASFCPHVPEAENAPLGLKILVDCSGSMGGTSIDQARKGLQKVLSVLKPTDYVSFSRFGSGVQHASKQLLPCDSASLKKLAAKLETMDADLGGTEMDLALNSTFNDIKAPEGVPASVLLITDGDVWNIDNILTSAKKSGQRIFAIGVGFAPAESLLRNMAEKSGGACEFVSPNENMAEAIVRMFHRMRGAVAKNIGIDWGVKPVWRENAPDFIYDGETVHSFALFSEKPAHGPVLSWHVAGERYGQEIAGIEQTGLNELARLGRLAQLEQAASKKEKLALALRHELLSDLTSLILVHERTDKAKGLPKVQHTPQMRAHGHGNYMQAFGGGMAMRCFVSPAFFSSQLPFHPGSMFGEELVDFGDLDLPETAPAGCDKSLAANAVQALLGKVYELTSMSGFISLLEKNPAFADLIAFVRAIAAETGIPVETVLSALIRNAARSGELNRHALRLCAKGTAEQEEQLKERFQSWLGNA